MSDDPALEFSLQLAADRLTLSAGKRVAFGWLTVEALELEVPGVSAPFELAGGAGQFRRRRCRVSAAQLTTDDAGLAILARRRAAALLAAGLDEVGLRILEGVVEIAARVHAGTRAAEMTVRATLSPAARGLTVTLDDARLHGWIGRPAQAVAHDLLLALTGVGEATTPESPRVSGPASVEVFPLEAALFDLLPPAGWRLPDTEGVVVTEAHLTRGRLALTFGAGVVNVPEPASARVIAADARLLAGDPIDAAAGYRAALAAGEPRALEHLLALLAGHPATLADADRLARQTLARDPDSIPALLARAAVALATDRGAEAASFYARLADLAEHAGDDEDAVRAALAAARTGSAADATLLYEKIFDRRPLHAEAAEALAERYAEAGRWTDLVRLAYRRIAAGSDRREQAREHARAGEIYLLRLGDPIRARAELQRSTALHDRDPRTWDLLARALEAAGDRPGAVRAIERQVSLFAAKGDVLGEARAHLRAGRLWEHAGEDSPDLERAHLRYRRALELGPGDPDTLERLAVVAGRRGALDESIAAWQRLAEISVTDDVRRRRALHALARALLASGDLDRARAALRQAAGGAPAEEAESQALAAALAEKLPADTDEPALRIAAARARLAAGDAPAALALAVAAWSSAPDEARAILGEAAWHTRAWDRVIEAYQPQISNGITDSTLEPAARLAIALEQVGRPDDAMTIHRAIADHPGATGEPLRAAQKRLADLHERRAQRLRQDPTQAIAELEAALRLVPDHLPSLDALESLHAGDPERLAAILGRKIAATTRQPEKQKALLTRLADLQEQTLNRPDVAKEIRKRIEELDRKP